MDAWHYELLRLGFKWRYCFPGERAPDGRMCVRFYWRERSVLKLSQMKTID